MADAYLQLVAANRLDKEIARILATSAALRRALMQAAFSGQLTGHSSDLDRAEEAIE